MSINITANIQTGILHLVLIFSVEFVMQKDLSYEWGILSGGVFVLVVKYSGGVFVLVVKFSGGGFVLVVKLCGRVFVLVVKFSGGVFVLVVKFSGGGFCPSCKI